MFNAIYKDKNYRSTMWINKHIVVFIYQLNRFILDVYNDVHQFSDNSACAAK
jgi:hypothetical protein